MDDEVTTRPREELVAEPGSGGRRTHSSAHDGPPSALSCSNAHGRPSPGIGNVAHPHTAEKNAHSAGGGRRRSPLGYHRAPKDGCRSVSPQRGRPSATPVYRFPRARGRRMEKSLGRGRAARLSAQPRGAAAPTEPSL